MKSDNRLNVIEETANMMEYPDTIQEAVDEEILKSEMILGSAKLNMDVFISANTIAMHMAPMVKPSRAKSGCSD